MVNILLKEQVAWYGEGDYTYSNTTKKPLVWTLELLELKEIVESLAGTKFNSCLLNLYHDGNEGIAWHSDDEKELGDVIASNFIRARQVGFYLNINRLKRRWS